MSFTIVQHGTASFQQTSNTAHPSTVTYTFPSANTAGNMLLVVVSIHGIWESGSMGDSRNAYTTIRQFTWNGDKAFTGAYVVPSCAAGSNTVSASWDWVGLGGFYSSPNIITIECFEIAFTGRVTLGQSNFFTNPGGTGTMFCSIALATGNTFTASITEPSIGRDFGFILFDIIAGGADYVFCSLNSGDVIVTPAEAHSISSNYGPEADMIQVNDGQQTTRVGFFTASPIQPKIMEFLLP